MEKTVATAVGIVAVERAVVLRAAVAKAVGAWTAAIAAGRAEPGRAAVEKAVP